MDDPPSAVAVPKRNVSAMAALVLSSTSSGGHEAKPVGRRHSRGALVSKLLFVRSLGLAPNAYDDASDLFVGVHWE